jgi:hypothetical protein
MKIFAALLTLFVTPVYAEYVITTDAQGIEVIDNWNGKSTVIGTYAPNPVPITPTEQYPPVLQPQPNMIAINTAGTYVFGYWDQASSALYWSFKVNANGTLTAVGHISDIGGPCAFCSGYNYGMIASANYLYMLNDAEQGELLILKTINGQFSQVGIFTVALTLASGQPVNPESITVDTSEHWLYLYYAAAGGAVDTVSIYNIQSLPKLIFIATRPITNDVLIVP